MTSLIEEIEIKITIDHCGADSIVLGGPNDLRATAMFLLAEHLGEWLRDRVMEAAAEKPGVRVDYLNTGLYEVPELTGGDN